MSEILFSRGIKGLIVASQRYEQDAALAFDWAHFSGVKIDFFPHEPELHHVTNDQRAIVQLAMRRTLAAGYRRVGLVMHRRWDLGMDRAWSSGFLAEQQDVPERERVPILFFPEPAEMGSAPDARADHPVPLAAFRDWYREHRPDAIISYGPLARPTIDAMRLRVPQDVGFVDVFLELQGNATAGVRQNCNRVGELAVELVVGQLQQHTYGIPPCPTVTMVEGSWCDGASLPPRA